MSRGPGGPPPAPHTPPPRATARGTVPSTYAFLVTPFPSRIYPLPDTRFGFLLRRNIAQESRDAIIFFASFLPLPSSEEKLAQPNKLPFGKVRYLANPFFLIHARPDF